jgi:tRNA A-37 threonylcarbamoyl transferase component Bud32
MTDLFPRGRQSPRLRLHRRQGSAVSTNFGQPIAGLGLGTKIADYRLDEQIGRGGMAVVYRATDERPDRRIALKVLVPELARDHTFQQRFIRESRAAAAVDHPNIIPIYDAGDAAGVLFIAMRYVQGGDVRQLLERTGPLSAARAWSIITQVALALDTAHAHGLIHRDVKPANMLLDAGSAMPGAAPQPIAGDHLEHVYLSDFGISKHSLSTGLTSTGQFVGTLDYVAPEQIEGRGVDGRTDLYSLACAAFEMLCGAPPFGRDRGLALMFAQLSEPPPSLSGRRDGLPAAADQVLERALAKDPAGRYPTCMEFARELGWAMEVASGTLEALGTPAAPGAPGRPATRRVVTAGAADQPRPGQPARPPRPQPGPVAMPGSGRPGGQPAPRHEPAVHARRPGPAAGQQRQGGVAEPPGAAVPGWTVPGPGSPDQPGWTGAAPQPPKRRSGALLAGSAIAAVAVIAAAAAVILVQMKHSSSPTPAPGLTATSPATSPLASQEAARVNDVLNASAGSVTALRTALNDDMLNCANPARGVAQIQQVVSQRRAEYAQAKALSVGALANGAEMKTDLTSALFYSLQADRDYLGWARQQQLSGCAPQAGSGAHAAAGSAGGQASTAKSAFVGLWNPAAAHYGFRARSPDQI